MFVTFFAKLPCIFYLLGLNRIRSNWHFSIRYPIDNPASNNSPKTRPLQKDQRRESQWNGHRLQTNSAAIQKRRIRKPKKQQNHVHVLLGRSGQKRNKEREMASRFWYRVWFDRFSTRQHRRRQRILQVSEERGRQCLAIGIVVKME